MYLSLSSLPSPTDPGFTSNNFKLYTSKFSLVSPFVLPFRNQSIDFFLKCPSRSIITYLLLLYNLDHSSSRVQTSSTKSFCVFTIFRRSWILSFLSPILFSSFLKNYLSLHMISYLPNFSYDYAVV